MISEPLSRRPDRSPDHCVPPEPHISRSHSNFGESLQVQTLIEAGAAEVPFRTLLSLVAEVHDREIAAVKGTHLPELRRKSSTLAQSKQQVNANAITIKSVDVDSPSLPGMLDAAADASTACEPGATDNPVSIETFEEKSDDNIMDLEAYPLLPLWKKRPTSSRRTQAMPHYQNNHHLDAKPDDGESVVIVGADSGFRHVIAYPSSPCRLVWDFVGAMLIFWDLVTIPLQAFDPPETDMVAFLTWFSLIFWTLNIVAMFLVGYVKDGRTIMSPMSIAEHYLKTWFVVDLLVVLPDWAFTMAAVSNMEDSSDNNARDSVRLLRTLRLMRMVRLLRLLKLRKILRNLNDLIDSEYASIMANIVKMILLLLVINHYIGCIWFLMGNLDERDDTWIKKHNFDGVDWRYQYLTAYHWSITQFTPASMSVQATNIPERAFAITVVVFALVGFSYVVGSITGSLAQLRVMQEDATTQFWNLRRFLKMNKIGFTLSARIHRYLEHQWQNQHSHVSVKHTKILSLLSEQLHCELQWELSEPLLHVHPLFKQLCSVSKVTMHRLANNALFRKSLARHDCLFISGETATHMYIVVEGTLEYNKMDSQGACIQETVEKREDWISEPVLWTSEWIHIGWLQSTTECDLLLVDPNKFGDIIALNPPAFSHAKTYAFNFLRWLNSLEPDKMSDVWQGEEVTEMIRGFTARKLPTDDDGESTQMGATGRALAMSRRGGTKREEPLRPQPFTAQFTGPFQ